jgi:hypothetical protein
MSNKTYNEDGFLVDKFGTHGLAGSLGCPCHDKDCNVCCPCKIFNKCSVCIEYYKTHKTPDQEVHDHIRNETIDDVVRLIESLGWTTSGWGYVIDMINEKLRIKKDEKQIDIITKEVVK